MRLEAPHAAVADVVVRHETFPDDTAADVCRAYMREGGDPKAVVGALRKSCAPANLLSFADEFLASNFTRSGL
jgi:hypothetical protein